MYFLLADRLQLGRLRDLIVALPRDDRWATVAGRRCAMTCTPRTPR